MESEGSSSNFWLSYTTRYVTLKELFKASMPHLLIRKMG